MLVGPVITKWIQLNLGYTDTRQNDRMLYKYLIYEGFLSGLHSLNSCWNLNHLKVFLLLDELLLSVFEGLAWTNDSKSDAVSSFKFLIGSLLMVRSKTRTQTKPDQPSRPQVDDDDYSKMFMACSKVFLIGCQIQTCIWFQRYSKWLDNFLTDLLFLWTAWFRNWNSSKTRLALGSVLSTRVMDFQSLKSNVYSFLISNPHVVLIIMLSLLIGSALLH